MRLRQLVQSLILGGLLLSVAQPTFAQTGTITGLVRSADTGAPLIAAVVQVAGPDGGRAGSSLTNQSGRFQISGISPGTYALTVSITGYETGRLATLQVGAGQTATANFDLAPRAIDLDPVVVSASRRQERALDAPARTEVVTEQEIEVRPTVTPVDHLRSTPGVDVATHGLQSTNVVARGFNNIFSGSLYTLTDHRMAGVPSLRVNLMHLIPLTDSDIERMEVVLGPGSALYGPNTANGVLHILTKSPLADQSTTASIAGGERSVFMGNFRTAQLLSDNVGVKVSGQYMRGDEWRHEDPVEALARARALPGDPNTRVGLRDYSIERWSGEARADWAITPDATTILSVGRTVAMNAIELTGIGAAQVRDWSYSYYQARFNWNRLFAQLYLNASDAGDTYTLRDGLPLTDRSRLFVAQAQHGLNLGNRQSFTYGLDYIRTMPETEGTIHGRYEDMDEYSELGGYLQSETALTPQFDLVLAGRLDTHSELDNTVFSPRAAVVFKPTPSHSLRASYNQAFSTPRALDMFLDISAGPFPDETLGGLGYGTRAMGPGREGFQFRTASGGLTGMRSPFTPAGLGGPSQLLPADTETMWELAVGVLRAQGAIDATTQAILTSPLVAPTSAQVGIMGLDVLTHPAPVPIGEVEIPDYGRLSETNTTTYEVGYKGLIGERLLLAADVWFARRDNFISALRPVTPLLFLNGPQIAAHLVSRGFSPAQAAQLAEGIAMIPVGVVSSDAVSAAGAEFLVTYRNFGEIDLWGSDFSAQVLLTDQWSATAMASFVDRDHFRSEGELITLNAPKTKFAGSVAYRNAGFNGEARIRHSASFPVLSAPFVATECIGETGRLVESCVEGFNLFDVVLGYRVPQLRGAAIQLAVQNLFDTSYQSFPGVPEIGRMALLRLRYDF